MVGDTSVAIRLVGQQVNSFGWSTSQFVWLVNKSLRRYPESALSEVSGWIVAAKNSKSLGRLTFGQ